MQTWSKFASKQRNPKKDLSAKKLNATALIEVKCDT
jgi:hypothetical protein